MSISVRVPGDGDFQDFGKIRDNDTVSQSPVSGPRYRHRRGVLPEDGIDRGRYRFAESLGQPVTEIAPGLTPLLIRPFPFASLAGISFDNAPFSVWREGKKVSDHRGDVLFTHLGLSGPGILDASRGIRPGDVVRLSFVGTMKREEFAADLARRAQENRNWQVGTILAAYPIPERLNRKLLGLSEIPDDLRVRSLLCCTAVPSHSKLHGIPDDR